MTQAPNKPGAQGLLTDPVTPPTPDEPEIKKDVNGKAETLDKRAIKSSPTT